MDDNARKHSSSLPTLHLEPAEENDQPESDQHICWGDTEAEMGSEESELLSMSDLECSLTPSPVGDISGWIAKSCPQLEEDKQGTRFLRDRSSSIGGSCRDINERDRFFQSCNSLQVRKYSQYLLLKLT